MINRRSRHLFAAILVARAICGIGTAQAAWNIDGNKIGGGNIVTGTGTLLPNVGTAGVLDTSGGDIYNNSVTMAAGSTSLALQSFDASGNNVLDNDFTVDGSITRGVGGTAVLFNGALVSGNTPDGDPGWPDQQCRDRGAHRRPHRHDARRQHRGQLRPDQRHALRGRDRRYGRSVRQPCHQPGIGNDHGGRQLGCRHRHVFRGWGHHRPHRWFRDAARLGHQPWFHRGRRCGVCRLGGHPGPGEQHLRLPGHQRG